MLAAERRKITKLLQAGFSLILRNRWRHDHRWMHLVRRRGCKADSSFSFPDEPETRRDFVKRQKPMNSFRYPAKSGPCFRRQHSPHLSEDGASKAISDPRGSSDGTYADP